jgi:hypothetical protein
MNKYEAAEVIVVGTANEMILGEKVLWITSAVAIHSFEKKHSRCSMSRTTMDSHRP